VLPVRYYVPSLQPFEKLCEKAGPPTMLPKIVARASSLLRMTTLWCVRSGLLSETCPILAKLILVFKTEMSKLDLREVKTQEAETRAEVYTRSMMCSNAGLPCWYPAPCPMTGETGIVPGDVGTFDLTRGFRKIFNLREFAVQDRLPSLEFTPRPHFNQGHVLVEGIYSLKPSRSSQKR
jgi:hypothetical protein